MSCSTLKIEDARPVYSAPVRPPITWVQQGERLSISTEEAVALARYLYEVDAYIAKTSQP